MLWNWQLPDWPKFLYSLDQIDLLERQFLLDVGSASAYLKTVNEEDKKRFIVEILSTEGLGSSKIEGEILDRESLQSSIGRHFGLQAPRKAHADRESRMAQLLCDVYETFPKPLSHEMLFRWHKVLFGDAESGHYRTHSEPMQIVSHRLDEQKVFFEAPPSSRIEKEMNAFIKWFNRPHASIFAKAAAAHVYFESIHPFEDGNGRIGRLIIEKVLSQGVGRPILVAISKTLEKRRKEYYAALEKCNRSLNIQDWVEFFADTVCLAQRDSMRDLYFLIEKSKLLTRLEGQVNERQKKVLFRVLAEGPDGFKGGLSAENYIAMTKTSRATATRDLTELLEKGALKKTGELRHTRYWLNF